MKKSILSLTLLSLFYIQSNACAWYDPDYMYFNLFTQSIIRDKSYTPFLLTYDNKFYATQGVIIPDENIEAWQIFFKNQLHYNEVKHLVNEININELRKIKKGGSSTDALLARLGKNFYSQNQEAIDYLIEAKYLEPYMRINFVENGDSFYYRENSNELDATKLDYYKTIAALNSLYNAAKNPEIKLRYGYQLVRFNHYTRNYEEAVNAFQKYVTPLHLKSTPYYLALDQLAGAQRGLKKMEDANWNFFQVFMHTKSRKQEAFVSMQLSDENYFNNLLKRAQTNDEKNMAYFLLGYQDFNNPIPMMQKMYDIDPNSEMLKVLAARAVNELERSYLPDYYGNGDLSENQKSTETSSDTTETKSTSNHQEKNWWTNVKNWFKDLFSSDKKQNPEENTNPPSDDSYLNNPHRIPTYIKNANEFFYGEDNDDVNYLTDLESMTEKIKDKSDDPFWKITDAYLKFLNQKYEESNEILNNITTHNPEYLTQIQQMKMLNDIVAQPKITADFEKHLYENYKEFFIEEPVTDTIPEKEYHFEPQSSRAFLKDVLANRYFLQGEDAKSFLMNNPLSALTYNPNLKLTKSLQAFFNKADKTLFEREIIAKNIDEIGSPEAFFNVIYGDFAMRNGDFDSAINYYKNGKDFSIPHAEGYYDYEKGEYVKYEDPSVLYDGYNNISSLVFGHNVWESYQSPENVSMIAENFVKDFPIIKEKMNKEELASVVLQLQKIGKGKNEKAAKANQLIGNLLYNTSKLGYFREIFVMDTDNSNGGKYDFGSETLAYQYYYKNYSSDVYTQPDKFDLAISYYDKALKASTDREQKARILFQMASAEQGKFYQWEATDQKEIPYDENWSKNHEEQELNRQKVQRQRYKTYFTLLKKDYSDTETSKSLMGSCTYYDYFMKK